MPPAKHSSLNTALLIISLIGGAITTIKFVAPLHTMPEEMRGLQGEVRDMSKVQAVQTEALKTLADIATDTEEIRRDVDRHDAQLHDVHRRLNTLERTP